VEIGTRIAPAGGELGIVLSCEGSAKGVGSVMADLGVAGAPATLIFVAIRELGTARRGESSERARSSIHWKVSIAKPRLWRGDAMFTFF
jgi:hypothetical protein